MKNRLLRAFVASSIVLGQTVLALPARADTVQTVTLNPVADSYIWTGESGAQNYGTQANLSVLYGSGANRARSLLRFDLSSIPSDATISEANLGLTISTAAGSGTINVNANRIVNAWEETTVTWNDQPGTSETISSSYVTHDPGTKTWGLTTAVQNWVSGAWQNLGVMIIGRESGAASDAYTRSFWSREGSTPPTLTVTYTVPADTRTPAITNVAISDLTETGVTVTWTTDEIGTSKVEYGPTNAYGSTIDDVTLNTTHAVALTGLATDTTYHFRVLSSDQAENTASSEDQTFTTSMPVAPPPATRLIKTACAAGAAADHPCKAVYYQGTDGQRHAFPNEKIFRTWYLDFSTVQTISDSEMASISLGENVHYRPGIRLLKFQTLPKVYALARGGVMRWVTTEEVAAAAFGSDWNQKIDDLSDAFVADYTFGADIVSATDYITSAEMNAASSIDADQGR
ncbi:hypothetical protein A3F28_01765 [Candidatus Uhrbacteria bacterium RIFCSPHIGHO2_12_FULL_57_11]|uniref:Fibronectin type-III domain-containing protein n=2 Tax=Candidatus Uhriibacteriota TaxID=1752732 RepID=A0A1F7UMH0_9BACT|nr:MAG: hypothetical protein A3D72_02335 [Candidatus Uhrbacteria bacterium RIFCSPHIGHO2_02_FULL_57_19]OGL79491.1 MAG: hypothetical protein A3F28_01765 [Candidatus Uhrbacteria bacterium RIFCSPHIGHO2_12_FULL_57_11]